MSKEVIEENIEEKDEKEYEYVQKYGHCIYCGQHRYIDVWEGDLEKIHSPEEYTQYINLLATEQCECETAEMQKRIKTRAERGKAVVNQYFREDFDEVATIMCEAVEQIAQEKFKKITIDTGHNVKAIAEINSSGNIKIHRKVTKNNSIEV